MSKKPYELCTDLNVINHLGLNLYSNVSAVLSEIIANAWDAEARRVDISISIEKGKNKQITIEDNGCGMNDNDLRDKFLKVGYERRNKDDKSTDLTPNMKRPVMGRKGIGKLSSLSIAGKVQVITKEKNSEILAIELDVDEIQKAIKEEGVYRPLIIDKPPGVNLEGSGTVLILSNFKKRILDSLTNHLRQRVARRFSVFSNNFQVFIDNEEVTLSDRNYFKKLEYSLVCGDYDKSNFDPNKTELVSIDGKMEKGYTVHGWIGLVEKSEELQEGDDNLNKISVIVRGKIAQEDILASFREGGLFTKYIIGELQADFLDSTDEIDIATSSRENFIGDDQRISILREFVRQQLRYLEREREKLKNNKGTKKSFGNSSHQRVV